MRSGVVDVDSRDRIGTDDAEPVGSVDRSGDESGRLETALGWQRWHPAVGCCTAGNAIGRPYPVPTPLGPAMQWLAETAPADSTRSPARSRSVTDRGVETWTTDPVRWRSAVCDLAGRSLSDDEWTPFGTDAPTPRC